MSRFSGLWVGMVAMADIMDGSATVNVDPSRLRIVTPPDDGSPRHITLAGLKLAGRHGSEERLRLFKLPAAKLYARRNRLNRVIWDSSRRAPRHCRQRQELARGASTRCASSASTSRWRTRLGLRLMKVSMPWPLDEQDMSAFAKGLETIFVVEAKRPLIEAQLKEQLYHLDAARRPAIVGKTERSGAPLLPQTGDIHAEDIVSALAKHLPTNELTAPMREIARRLEERKRQADGAATPNLAHALFLLGLSA